MEEEIQGIDRGFLKLWKVHGTDPGILTSVNTNSGN
jgi:hypothetical protein